VEFMEFPPHKPRGTLARHVSIVSVALLTLGVFRLAEDEITGKAEVSDAYGFTLLFVVAGYYIGWLPEIWRNGKRTVLGPFVMPSFYLLILLYLYFSFRSYFIQPGAAGFTILLQLFVMVCLLCRTE